MNLKNHILCIESLLKAHEYDKASKYVGNISNAFIGEKCNQYKSCDNKCHS